MQDPELAIVFVRTKRRCDEVTEALKKRGYMAEGLHGDLSQQKRDTVVRQFKEGTIDILVATTWQPGALIFPALPTYTTSTCPRIRKSTYTA